MSVYVRWTMAIAVLLSIAGVSGGVSAQPAGRHVGGGIKFNSGQNVQPVFQGWSKNADGSFTMHFGYFNRNYVERPHVPIGAENAIQPGGPDRGQPTHFYPGFNRSTFGVVVPGDWGKKELIWTLTVHGRTDKAVAWLQPEWEIDATGGGEEGGAAGGQQNAPPAIVVASGSSVVALPATLTLTATVTDDGLPPLAKPRRGGTSENPPAFRPESPLDTPINVPQYERPRVPARARLSVSWVVWRGPADVTFDPDVSEVTKDGKAITTAAFTKPGEYVLRARASDTKLSAAHDVRITVTDRR
jgi:hypothetical protein